MQQINFKTVTTVILPLDRLQNNTGQIEGLPANPRRIDPAKFERLRKSLTDNPEFLESNPLKVIAHGEKYVIIGGNMRRRALKDLGYKEVPCTILDPATPVEKLRAYIVLDNSNFGVWDIDALEADYTLDELTDWGVDLADTSDPETAAEQAEREKQERALKNLTDEFFYPPFSVIDTTRGKWLERKRQWLSMGISSEQGRGEDLMGGFESAKYCLIKYRLQEKFGREPTEREMVERLKANVITGTSIFDPVLTEIMYRWFNVPHGHILDPFAGGSVRGIVAAFLQMHYHGNDLRKEQIEENRAQLAAIPALATSSYQPLWTHGDSTGIGDLCSAEERNRKFDMIFSCPPYADLEVYSDDPADLSNMEYGDFLKSYREIIRKSCELLRPNRFAVFVVGDIRDKRGYYRNFVNDTIAAFEAAGLHYYNQLILINNAATLPIRVRPLFKTRKIGKRHQNVIVAYNGDDPQQAAENYENVNIRKCMEYFNDTRSPVSLNDYALCFIKGDHKIIKEEYAPAAVMSNLDIGK